MRKIWSFAYFSWFFLTYGPWNVKNGPFFKNVQLKKVKYLCKLQQISASESSYKVLQEMIERQISWVGSLVTVKHILVCKINTWRRLDLASLLLMRFLSTFFSTIQIRVFPLKSPNKPLGSSWLSLKICNVLT